MIGKQERHGKDGKGKIAEEPDAEVGYIDCKCSWRSYPTFPELFALNWACGTGLVPITIT